MTRDASWNFTDVPLCRKSEAPDVKKQSIILTKK
jgi:hypothetical protein